MSSDARYFTSPAASHTLFARMIFPLQAGLAGMMGMAGSSNVQVPAGSGESAQGTDARILHCGTCSLFGVAQAWDEPVQGWLKFTMRAARRGVGAALTALHLLARPAAGRGPEEA